MTRLVTALAPVESRLVEPDWAAIARLARERLSQRALVVLLTQVEVSAIDSGLLEAVAALSASLAHEIRNPLASIRSSVEQLARGAHAGDDERTLAALIVRESDRLSRLLSEFLDFSRVRATRSEPLDVHAVASAAAGVVRAHPDCPAGTQLMVEGDHVMFEGDEDLLHRSLVNLIMNAVQAADQEAVQVVVSVAAVDASEMPRDLPGDRGVRIGVSDTGPGIPDEIRERTRRFPE